MWAHRDAIGGHAEAPLDLSSGKPGRGEHAIGPVRMRTHERGIVAPNLTGGVLGVAEKMQVVNRDHLRGMARRQQQRVRRMYHVEGGTGERFGRRPAEALPREIEQANGNPAIDGPSRRQLGRQAQAVLPRAREQREIELAAGSGSRKSGDERPGELVGRFADAAAVAQRGAVVEKDAHARDTSIPVDGPPGERVRQRAPPVTRVESASWL